MEELLDQEHYCVINVWTSEKNTALEGVNVGHTSIQTHMAYYSLWPESFTDEERELFRNADPAERDRLIKANRSNFNIRPPNFIADYPGDVASEGCEALARIIFYSLDAAKMNQYFNNVLRPGVVQAGGWRMAGSNVLSRIGDSAESCASLVYRLLIAGGIEKLVGKLAMSTIGSQNSLAVSPDNVLKQILFAKRCELEKYPITKAFKVPGITENDVEELCRLHEVTGVKIGEPSDSNSASYSGCRLM